MCKCDNRGVSALNLVNASKKLGFNARGLKCEINDLNKIKLPAICHVTINKSYNHYVVLNKINNNKCYLFDPATGNKKYDIDEFKNIWNNIVIELIPIRKIDNINNKINLFKEILLKNKKTYIFISIISIISIILTIISNFYFKFLIDSINLSFILLFFTVVIMLKEITDYIRNKLIIKLDNNIERYLKINTHNKILSLPIYYFNSRTKGDIISKFNDLDYFKDLCIKIPIFLFVDSFLIITSTIILIKINDLLFLIFLIICLFYMAIIFLFNKGNKKLIIENQELNAINNSILIENVNSINTIKNLNINNYRDNIYNENYLNYLRCKKKYENRYNIENFIKNLIIFIGLNIILYIGIKYVKNDIIKLSDLILFNSLIMYFIEPLKSICELSPLFKQGINALKRIKEIYLIKNRNIKNIEFNSIKIKNLTYSYDGYNNIFKNLNLNINAKDKILITGSSGSGKSTLFKLLNKTYEVNNNCIYINNNDINTVNSNILYVSQDESLFNDSIYNNIVLDKSINNNVIIDTMKLTGLNKILKNKNIDLNSIISENGMNFSKGERQRIILTRVLLRNNNLLILDESLNGIDEEEEYEIIKNILKKYSNKTIIYITHRLKLKDLFKKIINMNCYKEAKNGINK